MDEQLIQRVVSEVLSQLKRQGAQAALRPRAATRAGGPSVPSRPRLIPPGEPTRVFLTAEMLARRLARGGGTAELAAHEFLTPAAADLADERHVAIHKRPTSLPAVKKEEPATALVEPGTGLGLVGGNGPSDRLLVEAMARDGIEPVCFDPAACWMANTRAMGAAIATGELAGGIIVQPHATDAMVLANKMPGVRAVQGTSAAAVAAGLRRFAANVLVLEQAGSTFHEQRAMARLFAAGRAGGPLADALMAHLRELEGV